MWGNILGWLDWKTTSSPTKLYSGNNIETSPAKNAEIMNKYYINKVKKIRAELRPATVDPLGPLRQMIRGCPTTFQFTPVAPDLVGKIIRNLKNSKLCGLDNVDSYILKLIREQVLAPLTHIVNFSLSSGVFPSSYKVGKVVPLYKGKGDIMEPSSYRPVCLLPVASKVLERCVFLQMVAYMEDNGYFHPNHHGFRNGHSTTTALLQMYDSWMEEVDNQQLVAACLIDLSATFDVVDAELLVAKLGLYGYSSHTQKWITSYMSARSQQCYLTHCCRRRRGRSQCTPGIILGPLLYLIFKNEFPEVIHAHPLTAKDSHPWKQRLNIDCMDCGSICTYADDRTYSTSEENQQTLSEKVSNKFTVMAKFLSSSKLKVNDNKTHTLLLTTAQMRRT